MKILIATRRLNDYTGTEIVTRDLALALRSLGHQPMVYSPRLGGPAREVAAAGIAVYGDVRHVPDAPDIVHGNHPKPLLDVLFHFPGLPAVAVCHDATSPRDEPVFHPRVLRYVAVDERCRGRIERVPAIPRDRIEVRLNAVDLARFARRPPLPPCPSRALVFSNNACRRTHLPPIEAACRSALLSLDAVGTRAGRPIAHPESVLGRYDVVFAKARCALEALATGAAVVLCDAGGLGAMVTSGNVDRLRAMNFGQGVLTRQPAVAALLVELRRYDAADADRVCTRIRAEASLEQSVKGWIRAYDEVIAEAARALPGRREEQAAFDRLREGWSLEARRERAEILLQRLRRLPLVGRPVQTIARRAVSLWVS